MKEYDCVQIVRLLSPERAYDGTTSVSRPPQIGDIGAIVYVHKRGDDVKGFIVENVDSSGNTVWLADFLVDEVAPLA